jgi:hypothetical protein
MIIWEINQHIRRGALPLHVAVELAAPGVLADMWRSDEQSGNQELVALLVFTRWRELLDALPKLFPEAKADVQALERSVARATDQFESRYWLDTLAIDKLWTAISRIAARAGGGFLLRSTDPAYVAAGKAVWQAVRDLGPPTLEEIVAAVEARDARLDQ